MNQHREATKWIAVAIKGRKLRLMADKEIENFQWLIRNLHFFRWLIRKLNLQLP
jgi:hypothetical protein